jgi:hypothetical protein
MAQPYWVMAVSIPTSRPEGAWGLADELERALGPRSSSGTGGGRRDIDWSFLSEETAREAKQKALAFFSERAIPTDDTAGAVQIDVLDYEDEEAA